MQDESYDEGEEETAAQPPMQAGEQPQFGTRDPQPYLPRDAQFFSPRDQQYGGRQPQGGERHNRGGDDGNVDRLPSFITGGQPLPQQPHQNAAGNQGAPAHGQNGFDNQGGGDRFPMHRRRRRHRGPRGDMPRGMPDGADDAQGPHGE
jgi:hypothetical protein